MIIKNGNVLNDSFKFETTDIEISGQKIAKIDKNITSDEVIDATDCYVVPGFVDTHMHGAMGEEFISYNDNTFEKIASYEAQHGTTSLVPAISAGVKEELLTAIRNMKKCVQTELDDCAKVWGLHMEGPFFSVAFKGAHKPENIRNTDIVEFKELYNEADGILKIMTLAPELPGAEEVVRYATENGVCISAGHTSATCDELKKSVEWGVKLGTHLFNAMSPLKHREPGAVGGILYEDIKCELICDFYHVRPEAISLVYRLKGREKINMITDSILAAGLPDGDYIEHNQSIHVVNGQSRLDDGTINGGTSCLVDGVRNLVSIGIPLEDACMMASKNPAQTVGIYDKTGSITEGKLADIVVLDKELNLKHVILRGKKLF